MGAAGAAELGGKMPMERPHAPRKRKGQIPLKPIKVIEALPAPLLLYVANARTGQTCFVEMSETDWVKKLKFYVNKFMGIPEEHQLLMHQGVELLNDNTQVAKLGGAHTKAQSPTRAPM